MGQELEHQTRAISTYVEIEAPGETVTHAERMIRSKIMGQEHEVWDVHTDSDRYWVVTNMTNLYSQKDFKSADYALSFHLGLMLRLMERDRSNPDPETEDTSPLSWRKHEQAASAFNSASEAEEFQAVGVHCREALIALAHSFADKVSTGESEAPKNANFKAWADLAAEQWAPERRLRAYLKSLSAHAWDLSVWLQHNGNATPWDADLVLEATKNVLEAFATAQLRNERGAPSRCPRCGSYRVESDGGVANHEPYIYWNEEVCAACENRWDHHYVHMVPGEGWVRITWPPLEEGDSSQPSIASP